MKFGRLTKHSRSHHGQARRRAILLEVAATVQAAGAPAEGNASSELRGIEKATHLAFRLPQPSLGIHVERSETQHSSDELFSLWLHL